MAAKIKPEDALQFDQALLRAPIDSMKRLQKAHQKTYDYNLGPASTIAKDLASLASLPVSSNEASLDPASSSDTTASPPSSSEAQALEQLTKVDAMLHRMRGLKRKLTEIGNATTVADRSLKSRTVYLYQSPLSLGLNGGGPRVALKHSSERVALQLADYMLRADPPMRETALVLAREANLEHLVDFDLWDELAKAEKALKERRLDQVLAWASQNKTALRKAKSPLEFTLHLQHFIELCRAGSHIDAISYASKYLAPTVASDSENMEQEALFKRAMALLAYGADTTCIPYQEFYSDQRWERLRALFRSTFLSLHSLPSLPLLHVSLQAGLATLKTPSCVAITTQRSSNKSDGAPSSQVSSSLKVGVHSLESAKSSAHSTIANPATRSCPLCTSPLSRLALEVPFSHHVNSTIVCRLSGEVVEGGVIGADSSTTDSKSETTTSVNSLLGSETTSSSATAAAARSGGAGSAGGAASTGTDTAGGSASTGSRNVFPFEGNGSSGGGLAALITKGSGEGRVFSHDALVDRIGAVYSKFVDPETGETLECGDYELKKVFIS